jgi:glycosyltransferase involved in cell wall biosynthesis
MKLLCVIPYEGYYGGIAEALCDEGARGHAIVAERLIAPYYRCYEKENKLETKKQMLWIMACNLWYFLYWATRFIIRGRYDVIVLASVTVTIPFLFLTRVVPVFRAKERTVIISFFVHGMGEWQCVRWLLRFLLNRQRIKIIVQAPSEVRFYRSIAPQASVLLFPYCAPEPSIEPTLPVASNFVFAGGITNRDYDCLVRAARLTRYSYVIIGSRKCPITETAPNVKILYDQPADVFFGYLKEAKIVVLPLKECTGASGQMVALRAMYFEKPIIYANVDSVAQYFTDGVSGVSYRAGDEEDLAKKLEFLMSKPDVQESMAKTACDVYYRHFHSSRFFEFIYDLIASNEEVEAEERV